MRLALASRLILPLAIVLAGLPSLAKEVCLSPPYDAEMGEISALARRLTETVAPYPSLAKAFNERAPTLCLDDSLYVEQAYYEPKTNRIVVRKSIDPDFQLAILVHEIRHVEQYGHDICPTTSFTLSDYMRARLALEADASAIGVYVAWEMREAGKPGPWDSLAVWPTHGDLVARFEAEIEAGGDDVAATAATYAQWFKDRDRVGMYAFSICANYLDALDRDNLDPGKLTLPADFSARLCMMPDGRPYGCALPP